MRVVFCVMSALAALLFAGSVSAEPLTNPLTPDQVTCDELQLERIALRLATLEAGDDFAHPSLLLWHGSQGGGTYSGLAVTDGISGSAVHLVRAETQLAFYLVFNLVADPLNPARPLLPHGSLVRRDQDSNLVTPTASAPAYLTVRMALEPNAKDPFLPTIPLVVNNLAAASGGEQPASHADAAGRGIKEDSLTASCENALTDFDQRIFNILARTVRVAQCALLPGPLPTCNPDSSAYTITLFRGADPHTYRANVYFYGEACLDTCLYRVLDKTAWQFKIDWDTSGRLTTGEVSVLPGCPNGSAPGCTDPNGGGTPTFILPPIWPGHGHQGQQFFDRGVLVGTRNNIPSAPVNWSALLADSAWN